MCTDKCKYTLMNSSRPFCGANHTRTRFKKTNIYQTKAHKTIFFLTKTAKSCALILPEHQQLYTKLYLIPSLV